MRINNAAKLGSQVGSYLILFAENKIACAVPELLSIARTLGIDEPTINEEYDNNHEQAERRKRYAVFESISEEDVKRIMSRPMLAKSALEIWGCGHDYLELAQSIASCPDQVKDKHFQSSVTYSIRVKGIGRKVRIESQSRKIDMLESVLPFEGEVNLSAPRAQFFIVEDYTDGSGRVHDAPRRLFFARHVADGQRRLIEQFSLKTRKFIGNTSMDAELSFLMANLACARVGTLAYDPFVGSGSLLVSAARFGACVVGADIDYNIVHARGKSSRKDAGLRRRDETIVDNLRQYGLQARYVDTLLCDAAAHAWRPAEMFDAIITDPPYGIRESSHKVGKARGVPVDLSTLPPGTQHYPEHTEYRLDSVFTDLLVYAARTLVTGGRLVYWLPVTRAKYSDDFVPKHSALALVYNREHVLNRHSSRRLIVMQKLPFRLSASDRASIETDFYSSSNAFRNNYFRKMGS